MVQQYARWKIITQVNVDIYSNVKISYQTLKTENKVTITLNARDGYVPEHIKNIYEDCRYHVRKIIKIKIIVYKNIDKNNIWMNEYINNMIQYDSDTH